MERKIIENDGTEAYRKCWNGSLQKMMEQKNVKKKTDTVDYIKFYIRMEEISQKIIHMTEQIIEND